MKPLLIILVLILSLFLTYGCSEKNDNMQSDDKKNSQIKDDNMKWNEEKIFAEYSSIVDKNESTLVEVYNWLYAKKGNFYLYLKEDGIIKINTDKGEEYEKINNKLGIIVELMKKNGFTEFEHLDDYNQIRLVRIIDEGNGYEQHMLIYTNEDKSPALNSIKIKNNFYYLLAIGE